MRYLLVDTAIDLAVVNIQVCANYLLFIIQFHTNMNKILLNVMRCILTALITQITALRVLLLYVSGHSATYLCTMMSCLSCMQGVLPILWFCFWGGQCAIMDIIDWEASSNDRTMMLPPSLHPALFINGESENVQLLIFNLLKGWSWGSKVCLKTICMFHYEFTV